ncbi:MAG: carboxylate-amine ligase [Pseudomonadota bacterium]
MKEPEFTIGIEEEYHLVDLETRDLAKDPPQALMKACTTQIGERVTGEFLRSQIEVGTRVCKTARQAGEELKELRGAIAEVASSFGIAPMAASTHPFARWKEQSPTDKERSQELAHDMQAIARRLLICGMHVHVGIPDDDLRIDILNQARYFLPHILALSSSSPFWQGADTGLRCYRLSVFDQLPRSGMPDQIENWAAYQRTINVLIATGTIEDTSKIWWDLRPHGTYPTIEMRICDVCTTRQDGVALAALFACLCRMLYRLRINNQRWRMYDTFLLNENRWRAQRYGWSAGLIDFGRGAVVPFEDLIEEIFELVGDDAEALDCVGEVAHLRTILQRGTSAERQLQWADAARAEGADDREVLSWVVDKLIAETQAEA